MDAGYRGDLAHLPLPLLADTPTKGVIVVTPAATIGQDDRLQAVKAIPHKLGGLWPETGASYHLLTEPSALVVVVLIGPYLADPARGVITAQGLGLRLLAGQRLPITWQDMGELAEV